ncbi:hypothetical protein BV898_10282 [Hypsibius exemplaris]|uniref:Isoamyl acetate-hydrolyzing esterase 1-like protein n=1 Tax=Hypsibius exemplaris TaxID=2072580 RepID=A0A1W0WK37_HYPEX|nr:hypothetical protein BV898_10282 [Hypsibius exemplaris]
MTTGRDWKSDLSDGIHLGRGGAAVFVNVLWPIVERLVKPYPQVPTSKAEGLPNNHIILGSPPPVDNIEWETCCRILKGRQFPRSDVAHYAGAVSDVAKLLGTQFGDLHGTMIQNSKWQSGLQDGLHLGPLGSAKFVQVVWPIIDDLLKPFPQWYPPWTDIDFRNPTLSPY